MIFHDWGFLRSTDEIEDKKELCKMNKHDLLLDDLLEGEWGS